MTSNLIDLDLRHVWHPFTHHGLWGDDGDPVVIIERAEGHELIDTEGRRYLDAISSLWCNTLGHRVPEIDRAIREQLDRVAHSTMLGLSSLPAIQLAKRLADLCPGDLDRVFYSDSGATAVEIALKIAVQRARLVDPRRTRVLSLADAYHGDTMGSVSLGYSSWFHRHFEHLVFDVERLPQKIDAAVSAIESAGSELCTVIVEPIVQGAAGMQVQPPGFLRAIREATERVGALLIADEVATGLWRTGRRFACDHESVVPDILCIAKGLTGGYLPLAATVVRPHVFEPFSTGGADGSRTFFHGHTYTGNALGCAAALAALDAVERHVETGRIARMVEKLGETLAPLSRHPAVVEIRQRGLMVGVELQAGPADERRAHRVAQHARKNGVMLRPIGSVMILMPPLSFSDDEIVRAVRALANGIDAVFTAIGEPETTAA